MSPVEINFMIFSPIWSLLALSAIIAVPKFFPSAVQNTGPKIGLLVLELITSLYWFGGFIALAMWLDDRICFGTVCSIAKAGTAISAVNWAAWTVTLVAGGLAAFRKGGNVSLGGIKKETKVEMHQGV
jgi:hypothetical protein